MAPGYLDREVYLTQGKLRLEVMKNFFSEKMVSHGSKLPRAVVESLWLEVFKSCMDVALGIWFNGAHSAAGLMVGLDDHRGLFQPYQFYDSMSLYQLSFQIVSSDSPTIKSVLNCRI